MNFIETENKIIKRYMNYRQFKLMFGQRLYDLQTLNKKLLTPARQWVNKCLNIENYELILLS